MLIVPHTHRLHDHGPSRAHPVGAAHHLLALGEVEPAWEIGPGLETLGPWTAGTDEPITLGAHNRVHPVTGDMFALNYDLISPTVRIHHIGPDGILRRSFDIALAAENVDICEPMFDGDPSEPNYQGKFWICNN